MNNPKRHHYVPEMLQRRFTNTEDGLWTLDCRNPKNGIWCGTIGNLLLEGHLYSHVHQDGSKDTSLETWFSELESESAPIIEQIVGRARLGKEPSLTANQRQT
jgi:hypothetical protein